LVTLNVEYSTLICIDSKCKHALKPTTISRHLRDRHKTPKELRRQVEQYVAEFPFTYGHIAVTLLSDGSIPQSIIPIVDGFQCKECPFKTQDRSNIRKLSSTKRSRGSVRMFGLRQALQIHSQAPPTGASSKSNTGNKAGVCDRKTASSSSLDPRSMASSYLYTTTRPKMPIALIP
jgi:Orsellinic acid/F9775 biosynthesis cluster protein D